jgi:CRP-like cAMP-binding protein
MPGLRAPRFLERLDAAEREALLRRARRVSCPAGTAIVAQGEPGDAAYILIEGEAVATQNSADGKMVNYRDILPGDLFGEIAALDGGPRSADVVARADCVLAALPRQDFEAALVASPTLALVMLRHLTTLVRLSTERVFVGVTMTVRQRLIHELLSRATPSAAGGQALELLPAPTHMDLAARIGTHREAVTKELAALANRKLIVRRGRCLTIPVPELLEAELNG